MQRRPPAVLLMNFKSMECVLGNVRCGYIKRDLGNQGGQKATKMISTPHTIRINIDGLYHETDRLLPDLIKVNRKYQETIVKKACCTTEAPP